jgi:cell division protein FtsI/penicillin-binding protein 2
MRKQYLFRIRIVIGVVLTVALVILVRLYMLQIVHGEEYRDIANNQYVRSSNGLFDRGSVFFTQRTGEHIAAATLKSGFLLALIPNRIEDPKKVYALLSKYIDIDKEVFFSRASKKDDPYEELVQHIDPDVAAKITAEDIEGVQLFREQWRYYPGGSMASHVLGFVGYGADGQVQGGQYGLERYWESVLVRKVDRLHVNLFAEIFTNARDTIERPEKVREGNIITSIEPSVQQALERVLASTQEEWNANFIGGIIIHPKTGAIYAMAAHPSFDPNLYAEAEDAQIFRNPFVENVYEMGSIIKPIAMAIGLDEGVVTAETTYNDTGYITLDTAKIGNYDGKARGVVNMQEVLNQSLNVGMAYVAEKLGGKVLGERMRAFGFGDETGIDLPFEVRGLVDNLDSPRKVEYATAAFGQGIALTPIATVRALSALGNGGYLVTPHFAVAQQYDSGEISNIEPDDKVQVISEESSKEITRMLVEVVDTALRGGAVKKERYQIAAKTGTAQIAMQGSRGYSEDKYLHSFFGYFPAYEPEFLIFLYHVEPQGARYASETLTTPFMDLVDFLINYYKIPPDR